MNLFEVSMENSNKVLLKSFAIENYRCIESDTIKVDSERGIVFTGESGVGKTTRIEALLWLLTGRLFDGSTNGLGDFILPKNATEDTVLSVSATFSVGMETFILEKKLKGRDVFYYVNGVKKTTAKDFNRAINIVFGLEEAVRRIETETKLLVKVDLLMLLTVLEYFQTLDNKTLRELVLLVGGNVDLKSLPMSENLKSVLTKYNYDLDDTKKEIKLRLKGDKVKVGLEKQIETLKTELKTHENTIKNSGITGDLTAVREELEQVRKDIATVAIELAKSESDKTLEIDNEIKALENKLETMRIARLSVQNESVSKMEKDLSDLRSKYAELDHEVKSINLKRETISQSISFNDGKITSLKERGRTLVEKKKLLKEKNTATCPQCQHVFVVGGEHEHAEVDGIDETLKDLRNEIKQLEQGIKDYIDEDLKLKDEAEKVAIKRDEIKSQGITLADVIAKHTQSRVEASTSDLISKDEQDTVQALNTLKKTKGNVSLDNVVERSRLKTEKTNLETRQEQLWQIIGNEKVYEMAKGEIVRIVSEIDTAQKTKNAFDQLEMEVKILEEEYLKQLDQKILNAFGENIRFKMFETNASNDNLTPICEMYVKDGLGRWVNAINGVNTGHSVPRLAEFIARVRGALGIRDGLLIIDFFESIGSEPLKDLLQYNQQVIATAVVRNQYELRKENL